MSDRELLELAAKAAGMTGWRYEGPITGLVKMINPDNPENTGSVGNAWNPLFDDGDALRLAVKLGMLVDVTSHSTVAIVNGYINHKEKHNGDQHTATRRAIVRAAAAIGEGMK